MSAIKMKTFLFLFLQVKVLFCVKNTYVDPFNGKLKGRATKRLVLSLTGSDSVDSEHTNNKFSSWSYPIQLYSDTSPMASVLWLADPLRQLTLHIFICKP